MCVCVCVCTSVCGFNFNQQAVVIQTEQKPDQNWPQQPSLPQAWIQQQHSSGSSSSSNKSGMRISVARGALLPVRQVGANLLKAREHVSGSLWPPGQRFNWCRRCCSSPVGVNSWALKCYKIDQTADTKIQKLRLARKSLPVRSAFYSLCTHQHTHRHLLHFYGSSFLGSVIKSIKVKVELFYSFRIFSPCQATWLAVNQFLLCIN